MVAKSSRIEAVIFVTVERRCIGHMLLFCMYPIVYNADFLWHFISIDIAFIGKIRHLLCADLKKNINVKLECSSICVGFISYNFNTYIQYIFKIPLWHAHLEQKGIPMTASTQSSFVIENLFIVGL